MTRTALGTSAIVLATASAGLWLMSYSWLLGPMSVFAPLSQFGVSPWFLAELAAIPVGAAAVLVAGIAHRQDSRRRALLAAALAGGLAALLSLLSVLSWSAT